MPTGIYLTRQNIFCVVFRVADDWQEGEVSGAVLWEVIALGPGYLPFVGGWEGKPWKFHQV